MSEITMKDDFRKEEESNELFSLQTIWVLFCQNWYWVLISALICVGVAFVYLRFKTPVYSASMKVLVKESGDKKNAFLNLHQKRGSLKSETASFIRSHRRAFVLFFLKIRHGSFQNGGFHRSQSGAFRGYAPSPAMPCRWHAPKR